MNSPFKEASSSNLPLGRHLSVLSRFYYDALSAKLQHLDIGRYYSVLLLVNSSNQSVTQQMVGDQLHIDKTSMVRVIDKLVEKNFIKRQTKPGDRRCYLIELTDEGEGVIPHIQSAIAELNHEVMQGFDDIKRKEFLGMLCEISKNLQQLNQLDEEKEVKQFKTIQ